MTCGAASLTITDFNKTSPKNKPLVLRTYWREFHISNIVVTARGTCKQSDVLPRCTKKHHTRILNMVFKIYTNCSNDAFYGLYQCRKISTSFPHVRWCGFRWKDQTMAKTQFYPSFKQQMCNSSRNSWIDCEIYFLVNNNVDI